MSFLSGRTSLTTVNTSDISDDAITLAKMAAGTANYNILYDGSGNPTEAVASSGGGTVLISSISASNAASVDFDSALSSTYTGYLLVGVGITPATTDTQLYLRVSSDGGSNWDDGASDYSWVGAGTEPGGGTSVARYDFADTHFALSGAPGSASGMWNDAVSNTSFSCIISHPSDTTLYTSFNATCSIHGWSNENGSKIASGVRLAAAAMNSVQVLAESGNITGRFNLYGLANS
tara:strand:+ start:102 stop:803 length:702 start_codon:yes stop_codon:yes gene_type:complete